MTVRGSGLRKLKKQMTRESIAEAAVRLVMDKGFDQVTIDEIAHEAFVSPRTFSNYFSCKEEAVVAGGLPDTTSIVDALVRAVGGRAAIARAGRHRRRVRPPDAPETLEIYLAKIRMGRDHANLRPFMAAQWGVFERQLREKVAQHTRIDSDEDMYPSLVAAAAVSAIQSALRLWEASGAPSSADLLRLVQKAFVQLEAGLPVPEPEVQHLTGLDKLRRQAQDMVGAAGRSRSPWGVIRKPASCRAELTWAEPKTCPPSARSTVSLPN